MSNDPNRPAPGADCPIPIADYPRVLTAHGGGGRLMNRLIEKLFVATFDNPELSRGHDGAVGELPPGRLAFSTDSYVVQPLFFPGGDIGSLSVHGTVNDLAMCGARPLWLSTGFILEEGFEMESLWRIVRSMREAADASDVRIVTGDTKVVERGSGDGVFINTAGVGVIEHDLEVAPQSIRPGDAVVLSGDVGRHGIAIMAAREQLGVETVVESDSAALSGIVLDLFRSGIAPRCLRDLTRGGLASAVIEIAEKSAMDIQLDEREIPVMDPVRGCCELLGLDPLFVANEGRFIAVVPPGEAERAAEVMRGHEAGRGARVVGRVGDGGRGLVTLTSAIGTRRILDMFSGEQLPRIC